MKTNKFNIWALIALLATTVFSSCDSDDPEPGEGTEGWSGYVVGLRATEGDASADYIVTADDLMSGTITSDGQGIEQAGWSYYASYGDNYFSLGYTLNECIGYRIDEGELYLNSKFVFERIDVVGELDDDTFLAIGAPWGGGSFDCQLQVVDANDVSITRTVNHPIYESFYYVDSLDAEVQLNAWPTSVHRAGDRVYVSLYPLHGTSWLTPNVDKALVSVYSYPDLEYIKTFEDDRTSPVGYYGGQPSLVVDEGGDIYTISSSSFFAGFTHVSKPSGILKINAGETEFDSDYFFNVEEEYGYKILNAKYVGNGKAVARVSEASEDISADLQWAGFGNYDVLKVVIVDLEAQTITDVNDIPVHAGQYQTPYLVEDGKVYMSIRQNSTGEAYVYLIDPETATAERGAQIDGIELQGIFKHN
ncbi:DUF4374 domain-containing protein [Marinoscillum sp.]|uniref:DUF4374 domain-containing protein n=1 Tax=Marinoscillum sp. TaxID=2024838 RepID=UPI003BACF09E